MEFTRSFHTLQSTRFLVCSILSQLQADYSKHLPKLTVQNCWFPLFQHRFLLLPIHVCLWIYDLTAERVRCSAPGRRPPAVPRAAAGRACGAQRWRAGCRPRPARSAPLAAPCLQRKMFLIWWMGEGEQVIMLTHEPFSYRYMYRLSLVVQVIFISFSVFSEFLIVSAYFMWAQNH